MQHDNFRNLLSIFTHWKDLYNQVTVFSYCFAKSDSHIRKKMVLFA